MNGVSLGPRSILDTNLQFSSAKPLFNGIDRLVGSMFAWSSPAAYLPCAVSGCESRRLPAASPPPQLKADGSRPHLHLQN